MGIQLNFKCSESWDKMPNTDKGKFCDKCTKNVFDLTNKSDTEIKQIYTENKGKMCGRIKQSQITMPFVSQHKQILAKFCAALYLVFGGWLFKSDIVAQNVDRTEEIIELGEIIQMNTIKGKVLDAETGEPLVGVNIHIESNNDLVGATTDENGIYTIYYDSHSANDTVEIIFTYFGYTKTKVKNVVLGEGETLVNDLLMNLDQEIILMGDVWIEEPPIINKDPEKHGETIIKSEEIKRSPY